MHSRSSLVSPKPTEKKGPTPKPARSWGPRGGSTALLRGAARREPGCCCGAAGDGRAGDAPRGPRGGVTVKVLPPWLCVSWPWEVRSTEGRNPPCRRERGRTIYSCAGGGSGSFSREQARMNLVLGAFLHPRGFKNHARKKVQTNLKTSAARGRRSVASAAAPPAPTRARLPPGEPARGPPSHGPARMRPREYFCYCCFG